MADIEDKAKELYLSGRWGDANDMLAKSGADKQKINDLFGQWEYEKWSKNQNTGKSANPEKAEENKILDFLNKSSKVSGGIDTAKIIKTILYTIIFELIIFSISPLFRDGLVSVASLILSTILPSLTNFSGFIIDVFTAATAFWIALLLAKRSFTTGFGTILIIFMLIFATGWTVNSGELSRIISPTGKIGELLDTFSCYMKNVLSPSGLSACIQSASGLTPKVEKVGGFEAIQLKFGSRDNSYSLPTLFARLDYVLPVSVINPNKIDTKLVVKNFAISNIFINSGTGTKRILCGSVPSGKISIGDISPEEERSVSIDFTNKIDCRKVVGGDPSFVPLYPSSVSVKGINQDQAKKVCNNDQAAKSSQACVDALNLFYYKYSIKPDVASSVDVAQYRYNAGENSCDCTLNQYYNIMDNLCFTDNDKATVELKSTYDFSVEGSGAFFLAKTAPKPALTPTIKSSAGPVTVTTYFVPSIHTFDGKSIAKKMFIDIRNDGDGIVTTTSVFVNDKDLTKLEKDKEINLLSDGSVTLTSCAKPVGLSIGKGSVSVACDVNVKDSASSQVTGPSKTVPVKVDIDYTYSQIQSTSPDVKKLTISANEDYQKARELNNQYSSLPYYCPTRSIDDTKSLAVYPICENFNQDDCNKLSSSKCTWADGICKYNAG
ncbi:MAG: hypothetical protein HYW23_03920 [Candidatus Aenigmarchaeota archaeon]|nr:hypothetical protein [Candidatus Aenigmarchaeota archaeon]